MAWYNTDNLELLYAPHKRDWRAEAFKKIKKVAIDVAKRSDVFRKASRRILLDERMGGYQKRTAHIATDPKVVLFSTFDGRGTATAPRPFMNICAAILVLRITLLCGLFGNRKIHVCAGSPQYLYGYRKHPGL